MPLFEEMGTHFRVTLYPASASKVPLSDWQEVLVQALTEQSYMTPKEIAGLWDVTSRTARTRLGKMLELGVLIRVATSEKDPKAKYKLANLTFTQDKEG